MPECLGPVTHRWDLDWVLGSCSRPGPARIVTGIWSLKQQWTISLSLSLYLPSTHRHSLCYSAFQTNQQIIFVIKNFRDKNLLWQRSRKLNDIFSTTLLIQRKGEWRHFWILSFDTNIEDSSHFSPYLFYAIYHLHVYFIFTLKLTCLFLFFALQQRILMLTDFLLTALLFTLNSFTRDNLQIFPAV